MPNLFAVGTCGWFPSVCVVGGDESDQFRAETGKISYISSIRGSDNPSVFLIEVHFVLLHNYNILAFHPYEAEHLTVQKYCHSVCFHVQSPYQSKNIVVCIRVLLNVRSAANSFDFLLINDIRSQIL